MLNQRHTFDKDIGLVLSMEMAHAFQAKVPVQASELKASGAASKSVMIVSMNV